MSISRTGYTDFILSRKLHTATDFLKLCLRNFGILYDLRDEPLSPDIPTYISRSEHAENFIAQAEEELNAFLNLTDEQWKQKFDSYISERKEYAGSFMKEVQEANDLLLPIRNAIEKWDCGDEYASVRKFALDQIDATLPNDKYTVDYIRSIGEEISWSIDDFKKNTVETARRRVENRKQALKYEIERNESANKYLSGFFSALEKLGGR